MRNFTFKNRSKQHKKGKRHTMRKNMMGGSRYGIDPEEKKLLDNLHSNSEYVDNLGSKYKKIGKYKYKIEGDKIIGKIGSLPFFSKKITLSADKDSIINSVQDRSKPLSKLIPPPESQTFQNELPI